MNLKNKIIKIFKEDIDSLKSLKVAAAGDSTPLRVRDTPPEDVSTKSYFLEGYVHQIVFKNIVQGQKRYYYTIYRKINKEEYDSLKKNYQVTYAIKPTADEEHKEDVYYTAIKKYVRTSKSTKETKTFESKNFIYLTKKDYDLYSKKIPTEYKLELVPIKDIYEKGIGVRNITIKEYLEYIEETEKEKTRKEKTKDTKKDITTNKEKISLFFLSDEIQKYIKSLLTNYDQKFKTDLSPEEREEASNRFENTKENLSSEINKLVASVPKGDRSVFEEEILSSLEDKLLNKEKIYNNFLKYHDSNSSTDTVTKDVPAQQPTQKPKDVATNKSSPEKVQLFLSDKKTKSNLNSIIQNYSDSIDKDRDEEDRDLSKDKYYNDIVEFLSYLFKNIKNEDDHNKVMANVKSYIAGFTDKPDLYNIIKKTYDKSIEMKRSKKISEASLEKKDYVVTTIVGSAVDKAYDSNKSKRKLGVKTVKTSPDEKEVEHASYILSLDPTQARNIENASRSPKLTGVVSIVPKEEYQKSYSDKKGSDVDVKGYRSASGERKQKETLPFDPTNPEDVASLKGKLKPGEKLYSVNFKVGDKRSEDVMMPISQIQKFVPDFKIVPDQKQQPTFNFEIERLRGTSKDTGNKIYDKIKGVLKLNSPNPINEPVKDPTSDPKKDPQTFGIGMGPQYYLINKDTKRVIKGFPRQADADNAAKEMGPEYISVSKINLPKYGINLPARAGVKEDFTDDDKKQVVSKAVSFKIESDPKDPDAVAEVKGLVKSATYNKEKKELTLTMDDNSQAIFTGTRSGNVTGVYNPDPSDKLGSVRKINDIAQPLRGVLDKVFPTPAAESKLEAYIRKRIQKALQENGINQYFGVQGPDVKKKRLEEYMKKYEWGFQKSEDPYVRGTGAEKHAIVSKLVHELGDEGVSIFNSYAPKGYEIARPDDLNDMADTPLGSQLYQPYDPNSLTARGGRVAEADEKEIDSRFADNIPMDQQLKNAEELAKDYMRDRTLSRGIQKNPNLGHVEKTIVNFIRKASERGTKKDIKSDSEIMKALRVISDRQMNKY